MNILKLWYLACLALGFYSIETLIEESHAVVYEKSNKSKPVQYLACGDLKLFYREKAEVDLERIKGYMSKVFDNPDVPMYAVRM